MMTGIIGVSKDEQKGYSTALTKALAFLRTQDFRNMPEGRHEIDGDKIFALLSRYTTRPQTECTPEAHRKFVDIQYVADGEEFLGWCPMSPDLVEMEPYDEARDVIFYRALIPESSILLKAGSYAVLYPEDVHRPGVSMLDEYPANVTKVVVKIDLELMKQ